MSPCSFMYASCASASPGALIQGIPYRSSNLMRSCSWGLAAIPPTLLSLFILGRSGPSRTNTRSPKRRNKLLSRYERVRMSPPLEFESAAGRRYFRHLLTRVTGPCAGRERAVEELGELSADHPTPLIPRLTNNHSEASTPILYPRTSGLFVNCCEVILLSETSV